MFGSVEKAIVLHKGQRRLVDPWLWVVWMLLALFHSSQDKINEIAIKTGRNIIPIYCLLSCLHLQWPQNQMSFWVTKGRRFCLRPSSRIASFFCLQKCLSHVVLLAECCVGHFKGHMRSGIREGSPHVCPCANSVPRCSHGLGKLPCGSWWWVKGESENTSDAISLSIPATSQTTLSYFCYDEVEDV